MVVFLLLIRCVAREGKGARLNFSVCQAASMPRRPRIHIDTVPLHIVQRGLNRGACFFDDYAQVLAGQKALSITRSTVYGQSGGNEVSGRPVSSIASSRATGYSSVINPWI